MCFTACLPVCLCLPVQGGIVVVGILACERPFHRQIPRARHQAPVRLVVCLSTCLSGRVNQSQRGISAIVPAISDLAIQPGRYAIGQLWSPVATGQPTATRRQQTPRSREIDIEKSVAFHGDPEKPQSIYRF